MKTESIELKRIHTNPGNPRTITDEQFQRLVDSLLVFPKMLGIRPIVIDENGNSLGGNMRYRALSFIADLSIDEIRERLSGMESFDSKTDYEQEALVKHWAGWLDKPTAHVVEADTLTEEEKREFIIKDNVGFGQWDYDALANEWDESLLEEWGLDVWQNEDSSGAGNTSNSAPKNGSLTDRFVVPPFSILDTRKGYWQDRKKAWKELIGDHGESRNDTLIASPEIKYKDLYQRTREHRESLGLGFREYMEKYISPEELEREASKVLSAGVSLLDPVMAELVCRWFGFDNCNTFDCFAGDTIFGYVSAYLGNNFTGIELREEQARLNNERVAGMSATYINDDGQNVADHLQAESQDLLFSCPPYFDLEKYSDDERDASNQETYEDFIKILETAFCNAIKCLKNDRFAVIVVGDVRDKDKGFYYDFVGDIKDIFKANGVRLYNDIVLIETGASTALRAGRYMESRKVAKMHQNVLVFYKGDPKKIKDHFKKIEYASEDLELFRVDSGDESEDA